MEYSLLYEEKTKSQLNKKSNRYSCCHILSKTILYTCVILFTLFSIFEMVIGSSVKDDSIKLSTFLIVNGFNNICLLITMFLTKLLYEHENNFFNCIHNDKLKLPLHIFQLVFVLYSFIWNIHGNIIEINYITSISTSVILTFIVISYLGIIVYILVNVIYYCDM